MQKRKIMTTSSFLPPDSMTENVIAKLFKLKKEIMFHQQHLMKLAKISLAMEFQIRFTEMFIEVQNNAFSDLSTLKEYIQLVAYSTKTYQLQFALNILYTILCRTQFFSLQNIQFTCSSSHLSEIIKINTWQFKWSYLE